MFSFVVFAIGCLMIHLLGDTCVAGEGKGNILGISMGSSEGGGYADADGNLNGWINETLLLFP